MNTKDKKSLMVIIICSIAFWVVALTGLGGIFADSAKHSGSSNLVECVCGGDGNCTICGGDGIAIWHRQDVVCSYCGGSGRHQLCGGTGRVDADYLRQSQEEKLKRIYNETGELYTIDIIDNDHQDDEDHGHTSAFTDNTCRKCHGLKYCSLCINGYRICGEGIAAGTCYNGKCGSCGGTGIYNGRKCSLCNNGICKRCNGSGKVKCSACNGTGNCSRCYGKGTES